MAATLQNIPIFVLEHKWSSDIESNVCSDIEETLERLDHSKENAGIHVNSIALPCFVFIHYAILLGIASHTIFCRAFLFYL